MKRVMVLLMIVILGGCAKPLTEYEKARMEGTVVEKYVLTSEITERGETKYKTLYDEHGNLVRDDKNRMVRREDGRILMDKNYKDVRTDENNYRYNKKNQLIYMMDDYREEEYKFTYNKRGLLATRETYRKGELLAKYEYSYELYPSGREKRVVEEIVVMKKIYYIHDIILANYSGEKKKNVFYYDTDGKLLKVLMENPRATKRENTCIDHTLLDIKEFRYDELGRIKKYSTFQIVNPKYLNYYKLKSKKVLVKELIFEWLDDEVYKNSKNHKSKLTIISIFPIIENVGGKLKLNEKSNIPYWWHDREEGYYLMDENYEFEFNENGYMVRYKDYQYTNLYLYDEYGNYITTHNLPRSKELKKDYKIEKNFLKEKKIVKYIHSINSKDIMIYDINNNVIEKYWEIYEEKEHYSKYLYKKSKIRKSYNDEVIWYINNERIIKEI